MNEQDQVELERLKRRQADLLAQFNELGRNLAALEARLAAGGTPRQAPMAAPPVIQTVAPTAIPIPSIAAPPPPIPAKEISVPLPRLEATASELPPVAPTGSPQTASAAPPTMPPPPLPPGDRSSSFELRLGTFWLVRIGIVMLLTGLVLFGTYAYHNYIGRIGAPGKLALLYLASGGLLAAGFWLQRREELKTYAQVLLAGGLAAVYFSTYAAHHIQQLRVIGSPVLDGALLLGWAGVIIGVADRRKSEVLALLAVLLAYYTSIITHAGLFTLYSNLILTVAAIFFLVRNRWAALSFASLVATYISYGFWRFYQDGHWQMADPHEGLWTGIYFLMAYWLVFSGAVFLSRGEKFVASRRAMFLSLNNAAFFTAFMATMWQVNEHGFWKFAIIYGTALLALAVAARLALAEEPLCRNAYLTQGLLLVTLGFITHITGMKLSLVLVAESTILAILGRQMQSRVMRVASLLAGILSVGWALEYFQIHDFNDMLKGCVIGAAMVFNACWLKAENRGKKTGIDLRATVFSTLALIIWFADTWDNAAPEWRGVMLAGEALVFAASFYALRLAELPLLGQSFLLIAQGAWIFDSMETPLTHPWWSAALIIAATLALAQWWQRQKALALERPARMFFQCLYAIAVVALLYFWFQPEFSAPAWLAFASLLALLVTAYAALSGLWLLAITGQLFLIVSAVEFIRQLSEDNPGPNWLLALVPAGALCLLSQTAVLWLKKRPDVSAGVRGPVIELGRIYRVVALLMSLWWVDKYVPARELCWAYVLAGSVVFALAGWRRNSEMLLFSAVFTLAGMFRFWAPKGDADPVYYANVLAILALLAQQRIVRRLPKIFPVPAAVQSAAIGIGGVSIWCLLTRWTMEKPGQFSLTLTAGWAVLALMLFVTGMALRERVYRWLGLLILAAALGRVGFVEVWKLETVYKILSFMALGIVLLVLGFIYNRYQEKIKEWL